MVFTLGKWLGLLCVVTSLHAFPSRIIVIRHGEKPVSPPPIPNVQLGNPKPFYKAGLTSVGQMRAAYLVGYFLGLPPSPPLFTDMVNYQGMPAKNPITYIAAWDTEDGNLSFRPVETVTPLANAVFPQYGVQAASNYTPNPKAVHGFSPPQLVDLQHILEQQTGTVIVCWKHHAIPSLIQSFGVSVDNPVYKNIFPNGKFPNPAPFNLTFIINYDGAWQKNTFSVDYQATFPGDSQ